MSYNVEGKKCVACKAYLFSEDDVVVCPVCGAPHHRSCYDKIGHCALEELHGTDKQYDDALETKTEELTAVKNEMPKSEFGGIASDEVKCHLCGEVYDKENTSCPKCGAPNLENVGGNRVVIDFLGGVSGKTDLGDGVTADEAKRFVFANTHKYIPKFARMKNGQKASFNIFAFFFPTAWALSRKMYSIGALIGAIEVALSTVSLSLMSSVEGLLSGARGFNNSEYYSEVMKFAATKNGKIFMIVGFASLIFKILMGIFGDLIYRNHVIEGVKNIKKDQDNADENYRKKGGVSLIFGLLGLIITMNLPDIILGFIM
ncbi:MAG: DUF2628 domain-containing protein [Clostridia bacterium]|nr:DUF2628 domain-containing protein [Clostridia bacterium]